ncbi:MAG: hypothetical protein KME17_12220 [Cyanosarcina radialis HA8281-LM2]|nr:hypothetical protein [Cyanosarcina radialis HA8281-LM2]
MSKRLGTNSPLPQFRPQETVSFIGGTGVVKDYRANSGSWTYLIEMEMGPRPQMGRVGYETTIWLAEADLHIPEEKLSSPYARV